MNPTTDKKLDHFYIDGQCQSVQFQETLTVKEGVECDTYSFIDDTSKDLAIVTVRNGCKTPLQRVLSGSRTLEGLVSGEGTLTVTGKDGSSKAYNLKDGKNTPIAVEIGQLMQWVAREDLVFYEVCYPPYQDGRFKNLPE